MYIELIEKVSLLVSMVFLVDLVSHRWNKSSKIYKILMGTIFGGVCIIGMEMPLVFSSGVIFDARSVILSLSGAFGGWLVALIAVVFAGAYRVWLGGGGAWVGLGVIITCALIGVAYSYLQKKRYLKFNMLQLALFGMFVQVSCILWFSLLPEEVFRRILDDIALPFVIIFTLVTILLGLLLNRSKLRLSAEGELEHDEKLFRDLYNHSPIIMHSIDNHGRLTNVNEQWLRTFGYNRDEVIGRLSTDLLDEKSKIFAKEVAIPHLKRDGFVKDIPYTFITSLGEDVDIKLSGYTRKDRQGDMLSGHAILIDETKQNVTRKKLENYANIFEKLKISNFIGIIQSNADGDIIEANDTMLEMLGYTREELNNITFDWKKWTPEEFLHLDLVAIKEAEVTGSWTPFEKEYFHKDGHRIPILIGGTRYSDDPKEYIIFIINTSDQKALEEQLRQSQRLEAVGQLTGGVAHDFNNILAVILGNVELVDQLKLSGDRLSESLQTIKGAVARASSLTNKLLSFSKELPLEPKVVEANQHFSDLSSLLQSILGEAISLEIQSSCKQGYMRVDPHQFDNAIVNIILNARDAMPHGGALKVIIRRIDVNEEFEANLNPGPYINIKIKDTGEGIHIDHLSKVTEPFFTTKSVGKGSGLGLSMVYGFVEQSHGHFSIESELNEGTQVNLYFSETQGDQIKTDVADNLNSTIFDNCSILLVEDDEDVRNIVSSLLTASGCTVSCTANAQEALDLIAQDPSVIDIVFTDVVMPGEIDGVELAQIIQRKYASIKVLITSGFPDRFAELKGRSESSLNLLAKPYNSATLFREIKSILSEKGR